MAYTDIADQTSYPWWAGVYAPQAERLRKITVDSQCKTVDGNVVGDPSDMMALAASFMVGNRIWSACPPNYTVATYTLARYMQSEVGDGSIFDMVGVGELAMHRAELENLPSVNNLLLYRQPTGNPHRGFYGPIHGSDNADGSKTAPYGRWAATSQDPSALALQLALLVTTGNSGNFTRGADDQDGLNNFAAFPHVQRKIDYQASMGSYWVGPIPGVNHWETTFWRQYGYSWTSLEGRTLAARAYTAFSDPKRAPIRWDAGLAIAPKPADIS